MNDSSLATRKLLVGVLAIGCLVTAAIACWNTHWTNPVVAVSSRMGLMLSVLWWALPKKGESIAWDKAFPVVLAIIVVLAFFKRGGGRTLLYVVPLAIVVGIAAVIIRPRPKRPR
jgi:hypothetical protein